MTHSFSFTFSLFSRDLFLQGHFRFEGPSFPSIQELILHQYQSETPVTSRSGSILKKPVLRERWELSNDDVILLDKIGRVSAMNCQKVPQLIPLS